MADNYRIDVVSDEKEIFEATIVLAFKVCGKYKECKASSWLVSDKSLILFQYETSTSGSHAFPVPFSAAIVSPFAWEWLQQQDYGRQPSHDGSNKKGFWLTTTSSTNYYSITDIWYNPGGHHGAIIKITPQWCMYGK